MDSGWDDLNEVVLTAGTGTGKTLAAFLPALRRGESVIAAYPTNALLRDQAESIGRLAALCGKAAQILRPGDDQGTEGPSDFEIIVIDGPALETARERLGVRRKGEVLDSLLTVSAKPKIVLTNPDVLYLLAAMCYRDSQSAIARLSRYRTLVLDEFHLYSGIELARCLYLAHLLRFFGGAVGPGLRLTMLSATPRPEVLALLRQSFPTLNEISPEVAVSGYQQAGLHTTVHPIRFSTEVLGHQAQDGEESGSGIAGWILRFLAERRESLLSLRSKCGERTVPALVFVNSVVQAVRIEQSLLARGWTEAELGSVRGLMSQKERSWQGKTVVIATAAAEVGIDFDCRLLVTEATELGSFVQRLGRSGRHTESEVVLVGQAGTSGLMGLSNELGRRSVTLTRAEFLGLAEATFPVADANAEFVCSWEGVFAAASLTDHILERVSADSGADVSARDRVRDTLLQKEKSYFARWQSRRGTILPDIAQLHSRVRRDMQRSAEDKSLAHGWIKVYAGNFPSFRAQTLQVAVHDLQEAQRNREATYRADLRTLARWAQLGTGHAFIKGSGFRVEIRGYENSPQRYFVLLHQPQDWPQTQDWPPDGLFWIGTEVNLSLRILTATLVSETSNGRFPGPFPPTDDPVLALVLPRSHLDSLGFDWRLQTWPLRRMVGTSHDAQARVVLLGDQCLLAKNRLGNGTD